MKFIRLTLFLAIFFFGYITNAQSISHLVISSGVNEFSNSTFSISYSFGETLINTDTGSSITLTQGFQQPVFKYFRDFDLDGFGNKYIFLFDFSPPAGYVLDSTDCNDSDKTITNKLTLSLFSKHFDTTCLNPMVLNTNKIYKTYLWSNNDTTPSVSITNSGLYFCKIYNGYCYASDTIIIQINKPTTFTTYKSICRGHSYLWNDTIYKSSGTYIDVLKNNSGCDSTDILNLTIKDTSLSNTNATICSNSSYIFNGTTYNTTGVFYALLTNINGCDSVAILNLTVNKTSQTSLFTSICNGKSYYYNGKTYYVSGTYTVHYTNSIGCDSSSTLTLTVNDNSKTIISQAICSGDSVKFNNKYLVSTGIYVDTLINSNSCDSVIILNLTVNPLPNPVIYIRHDTLFTTNRYIHYQWKFDGPNIVGGVLPFQKIKAKGIYAVDVVDSNGCSALSFPFIDTIVGVNNITGNLNQINVYPNPTYNVIKITTIAPVNVILYSLEGKVLVYKEDTKELDINQIAAGVYIIYVYDKTNHIILYRGTVIKTQK